MEILQRFYIPNEMLCQIFDYVTIHDRRNIRLVCQKWNELCSYRQFTTKEIFNFYNLSEKEELWPVLTNSKREFVEVKLYKMEFNKNDIPFWKTVGSKIRGLYFDNCRWDDNMLGDIIIECPNLSILNLHGCHFDLKTLKLTTEYLLEQNITRLELVSLSIFNNQARPELLPSELMPQLIYVFPNLKALNFDFYEYFSRRLEIPGLTNTNSITWPNISAGLLKLRNQIEELGLAHQRAVVPFTDVAQLQKLKKLRIGQAALNVTGHFPTSLTQMAFLRTLDVTVENISPSSAAFFVSVVDFLPRLRHLRYRLPSLLLVTEDLFKALLRSQLITLYIRGINYEYEELTIVDGWPANYTLRSLEIISDRETEADLLILLFMKYFSNVENLDTNITTKSNTIHKLNEYGAKLRSLSSVRIKLDDDEWNHLEYNNEYALGFQKLQYLHLNIIQNYSLTYSTMGSFNFPKLEYLNIALEKTPAYPLPENSMSIELITAFTLRAIENISSLVVLHFYDTKVSYASLLRLCTRLPKLRYLKISVDVFTDERSRELFQSCPSLEVFINIGNHDTFYVKDKLTNEIIERAQKNAGPCFFPTFKFGFRICDDLSKKQPIQGYFMQVWPITVQSIVPMSVLNGPQPMIWAPDQFPNILL